MNTVYLLIPNSEMAKQWVDDNVQCEEWQRMGKGIGVEHGYISDICEGMVEDGMIPGQDFDVIS